MASLGANRRNSWQVTASSVDLTRERRPPRRVTVASEPQTLTIDLERTACLVVDMQNDFCTEGGWLHGVGADVSLARRPVEPLRALLPVLRAADVPVVWLSWGARPDRANLPPGVLHVYDHDGEQVGIGDPLPSSGAHVLEAGSWSARVVDELTIEPGDVSVLKHRMSGFFDTELQGVLVNLDVSTILFAGVNVDQCVLATLTDAACLGYDCVLLTDCSATTSPGYCLDATLYNVRQCFGFLADGGQLIAAIMGEGAGG